MGVSLAWVAIQGMPPEAIHEKLSLLETGATGLYYNFPIAGRDLSNGWHLLTAKPCDHWIRSERVLSIISAEHSVVACSVEEHVMYVRAASWQDGREAWSIEHEGENGPMAELIVAGSPPQPYEELRRGLLAQQIAEGGAEADTDYLFDVPLQLARSIVGFKHDEADMNILSSFHELRQSAPDRLGSSQRPWWKIW